MLVRWNDQMWSDVGRALGDFDEMRRRMADFFEGRDFSGPDLGTAPISGAWPRVRLEDDGEQFRLEAVVPGLGEKDISLTLNRNVLTVTGERQLTLPEGYGLQRRERGSVRFSRSIALPGPVDPDKVDAKVRDGLLTVTLPRAEEAKPKQITVESA
ncbi:MAG: Hsp20/alpha crystallin family protein [Deltaproteobacteria bacterium]|nr:Hsp20/alpha crystallin family protein [Deltaproteobacteria bacterium]